MKSIYFLLFSIIILTSCSAQTGTANSIEYRAATRGSSITLLVNSRKIKYSDHSDSKEIELSKNQWREIEQLILKIDLASIKNLEAPSSNSATDRTLIASIAITKNSVLYQSSTFDHGNPPLELKELIDYLFELTD